MTREDLRAKLVELDKTVDLAEAEMERRRHHEESIRAMENSSEELLEHYAKLVPEELENLSPAKRRQVPQVLTRFGIG